ncbi:hypothetical protein LCGC14_1736760 [marine sediment metagenome]|uniref:Nucleotide-diphospho-sugar transferase domain-containing protein n=1 Tax=marine sediment metagenome TaxID=412755 RepID=A0A0F9HVI8_9ZZZZ
MMATAAAVHQENETIRLTWLLPAVARVRVESPEGRYPHALEDGAWRGRRCFVVGGGLSMRDFDWSRLNGELVIGVNRVIEDMTPAIWFTMDHRFLINLFGNQYYNKEQDVAQRITDFRGLKIWNNASATDTWDGNGIVEIKCPGEHHFTDSLAQGIGGGANSGYGALNLAWILGADPIYLLGFDMHGEGKNQAHYKSDFYHSAHKCSTGHFNHQFATVYKNFRANFERVAQERPDVAARVINLNPDSALKCFQFGKLDDVAAITRPIVISFYTPGTSYEQHAENLARSCVRWGLEHNIVPVESKGSWLENIRHKPHFIAEMLEKHGRAVLWVDVDGVIQRYPALYDNAEFDVGINWRDYELFPAPGRRSGLELLSGTMFWNYTEPSRELLRRWIVRMETNPNAYEQRVLESMFKDENFSVDGLRAKDMPPTYCQIFDLMAAAGEPVIEHFQASRTAKAEVDAA